MRPFLTGIPSVRRRNLHQKSLPPRGLFAQAFLVLLLLIGGAWSQRAAAAVAPTCDLSANAPTTVTDVPGSTVGFSFNIATRTFCSMPATALTVSIVSDTTGGAVLTQPTYAGGTAANVAFSVQLGPNLTAGGSVQVSVACPTTCGATTPITFTANSQVATMSLNKLLTGVSASIAGDPLVGSTLTYSVTATNTGAALLDRITISDPMLAATGGNCIRVAPRGTCVLTGTYVVQPSDAGKTVSNTATAVGAMVNTPLVVNATSNQVDSTIANPKQTISEPQPANADNDGSKSVTQNDVLTYNIVATNTGNIPLSSVTVSDTVAPSTGSNSTFCSTVNVGQSCTLTLTHVVSQTDVDNGSVSDASQVQSNEAGTLKTGVTTTVAGTPARAIAEGQPTSSGGAGPVVQNDVLTWTVTATNTGNIPLNNVVVSDAFGTTTCTIVSNVAPNNTCVLTATHTVTQADVNRGSITDQGSVTTSEIPAALKTTPVTTTIATSPALTLKKALTGKVDNDQSGNVTQADVLTYTYTVTNTGNVTLGTVTVSDTSIGFTGTCTNIPRKGLPGNTCTLTANYTVTATDAGNGSVSGSGTATTPQLTGSVSSAPTSTAVFAVRPSLTVRKAKTGFADNDGNGFVTTGDTLTYTFTVTNTGNEQLNTVTLNDPRIGYTGTCTNIPRQGQPGNTCTLVANYTVQPADATTNKGQLVNTAGAVADTVQQNGAAKASSNSVTTQVSIVNLGVQKQLTHNVDRDRSGTVTPGDVLTFTVTATNSGDVTLPSITVNDPLTAPNTTTCANVAAGGTCVLNGIYTVTASDAKNGSISNTGTATSPIIRTPASASVVTPVLATPAMTISKALTANADGDGSGTVTVGDVLTFTVTATNSGSVPLDNVVVNDPLTTPASHACKTINPGTTCVLTGKYTVTAGDASKGAISNTGTATAQELTAPVQATLRTPVSRTAPAMSVTKALAHNADGDHSGTVTQGDVLTYTVTATNTGTAILGNVQVDDPLTSPDTTTCATLAVGASCVLTGTYTVTATDVANKSISNTGSATSNQTSTSVSSNTITTPVLTTTALSITKVLTSNADGDKSGNVTPGDVLTYTVTATNSGNVQLNTVTVGDPLTTPNSASCSNVPANGTCALVGTYAVTAADATRGSISNTGSASAPGQINTPVTQTLNTQVFALNRTIAIVNGEGQSGPQNSTLNPLVVSVTNNNNPANGVTVNWAVTSGTAKLNVPSSLVAGGQATNIATLGATPGLVTITATRADDPTQSVTFHETITAPLLSPVSGNNQIGVVGADAAQPLVVHLVDGSGHPFANQTINWQVVSGPATLPPSPSVTDPNGDAQIGFTYGASTGAIVIRASYGGSTVDFDESAQAYRVKIIGGNNQTAAPGQRLPLDFSVQVSFPTGMTTAGRVPGVHTHAAASVANVPVQWTVLAGGGSLSQGNSTSTDTNGNTSNHYTLGTGAGTNQVQVTVPGGTTQTFSANSAATNANLQVVSGNNQSLVPGTPSAPMVVLLSANGIPLANVTVNWAASNATFASAATTTTSMTDGAGHASITATVTNIGPAVVTASVTTPSASPVAFALNGGLSGISGLTPIEGQITGALDNGCAALAAMTTLTPAQRDLLNQCNALAGSAGSNPGQVVDAVDQLFSDTAFLETSAAMLISTAQFDNINARIAALRSGTGGDHFGGLAFNSPDGSLPIGSLGANAFGFGVADKDDRKEAGSDFDRWGFFLSGTFTHGSADPRQALPGYGFNTNGVTAGVDYRASDKLIYGVSAGYAKYDSSLDGNVGTMDTHGWSLSAYATFFQKNNWYVDGVFTWGSNSYDINRKIAYTLTGPGGTTTVNQTATGNDSGNTMAAAVTLGRDFNKGPWSFGPYFRGMWTRVEFDGYQEVLDPNQPGSGLGLAVQTHPLKSTASVLGAKLNYASSQSWGVMMPHAEIEWQHEFQDNPDTITAHFLQDPTKTPITADGFPVDQDYFRLGLGVSFVFPRGKSGFIYYEKTLGRSGITQDSVALGLRVEF